MTVLSREVLVLNKGYNAIGFVSLKRAIAMVSKTYKDGTPVAKIVDPNDYQQFTWEDWGELLVDRGEDSIHSAHQEFRVPEVIILSRFEKLPQQKAKFNRRTLFRRDNFTCQYCAAQPHSSELTLDHVLPSSRGGKTTWDNIVCACVACNAKKANRTPDEAGMRLLSKPSKPRLPISRRQVQRCASWKNFVSEMYWSVELKNEN